MKIDFIKTTADTIHDRITKLRFLGLNDPCVFRKILESIVLTDMIEWGTDRDVDPNLIERLIERRNGIFFKNDFFKISYFGPKIYTSINTPHSNDDWKLVSDAPDVLYLQTPVSAQISYDTWERDPNYTPKTVEIFELTSIKQDGTYVMVPDIDISDFTTHDKMNTYVYTDIDTGEQTFYYLDENCNWKQAYTSKSGYDPADVTNEVQKQLQNLQIDNYTYGSDAMTTGISIAEGTKETGKIELATDDEIANLL